MPRRPPPFDVPDPHRRHGVSPMTFQSTRLSQYASMAFGCAVIGDADGVAQSCQQAQMVIDRLLAMTSHLLAQSGTSVSGKSTKE